MELFAKIVNGFQPSTIFGKLSILVSGRVLNTFLIILIIIITIIIIIIIMMIIIIVIMIIPRI